MIKLNKDKEIARCQQQQEQLEASIAELDQDFRETMKDLTAKLKKAEQSDSQSDIERLREKIKKARAEK